MGLKPEVFERLKINVQRKFYKKNQRHAEFISASHLKGMHYTGQLQTNCRPGKSECHVRCRNKFGMTVL
jgi:hypothetical protein